MNEQEEKCVRDEGAACSLAIVEVGKVAVPRLTTKGWPQEHFIPPVHYAKLSGTRGVQGPTSDADGFTSLPS